MGKAVNKAVITVPTTFSDVQKEALSSAAKDAGVEVLQYIPEPLAAVLAYDALPDAVLKDKIVVVADFGGQIRHSGHCLQGWNVYHTIDGT